MRHGKKIKQLGRIAKQRRALLRTQVVSLVEHGRIETTLAKAKFLQPYVERLITRAKKSGFSSSRELRKDFNDVTVKALVNKWAPLFATRNGGYTRLIKLKPRRSDASPMAMVELVEKPVEKPKEKVKKPEKPVKKPKPEKPAK
jgi:large subunit ribosomal protein L17